MSEVSGEELREKVKKNARFSSVVPDGVLGGVGTLGKRIVLESNRLQRGLGLLSWRHLEIGLEEREGGIAERATKASWVTSPFKEQNSEVLLERREVER